VSNVLSEEKQKQVIALGQLGWTLRRIEKQTGIRRETAAAYLRAAGVPVRPPGRWGRPPSPDSKPANEVTTDFGAESTAKPANEAGVTTDPATAESGARRTRLRGEAEQDSALIPNRIPG
jgi:hypothetical protein